MSSPPVGRRPASDAAWGTRVTEALSSISDAVYFLDRDDVRYVVLYKFGRQADLAGFSATPRRYRPVFQDSSVIIYAPLRAPCPDR